MSDLVTLNGKPKLERYDEGDRWHYIMDNSIEAVFSLGPGCYRFPISISYTDLDFDMGDVNDLQVDCEFAPAGWPHLDESEAERVSWR